MNKEIEGSGYVFKTNKKRYPLNKNYLELKSKVGNSKYKS
jgi:hypothetical protein